MIIPGKASGMLVHNAKLGVMETPLASILGFQEALLPAPADAIVGNLLRQVHSA